jgi:hypothetical protein
MAVGSSCFVSRLGEPPWVLQYSQLASCQSAGPSHRHAPRFRAIGGPVGHAAPGLRLETGRATSGSGPGPFVNRALALRMPAAVQTRSSLRYFKSDLRNHQATAQPRLYDCLMVTQITLKTESHHGLPSDRLPADSEVDPPMATDGEVLLHLSRLRLWSTQSYHLREVNRARTERLVREASGVTTRAKPGASGPARGYH